MPNKAVSVKTREEGMVIRILSRQGEGTGRDIVVDADIAGTVHKCLPTQNQEPVARVIGYQRDGKLDPFKEY